MQISYYGSTRASLRLALCCLDANIVANNEGEEGWT